jgi:ArsR family transcriptional regulator
MSTNQDILKLTQNADTVANLLRSLAHPIRLKILCCLLEKEKNVSEIVDFCKVSQSMVSQFLNRLRLEGMVVSRREGTNVYYEIADKKIYKFIKSLKEIFCN